MTKTLLLKHGIRPTFHRVQIAEYILRTHQHFSTHEIYVWAKSNLPKISLATVYNTVQDFYLKGIIKTVPQHGGSETLYDSNVSPHFHFLDVETNELMDIPMEQVKVQFNLDGIEVQSLDMFIRGIRKKIVGSEVPT